MKEVASDNDKYLELQFRHILERIDNFDNKLYLEFGGKLPDDHYVARALPGFQPDSKLEMLPELKEEVRIVIAVSVNDIERNKIRSDMGTTYDVEVLRLVDAFRDIGLYVGSVVITQYVSQASADTSKAHLEHLGIHVYLHYPVAGYLNNISLIVSGEGYGKNRYIETIKPLVVATAPGPGSGKMAICLSQLYREHKRGIRAGYAKFGTFSIWNLPLKHPVNLAYEAATADLNDTNMTDPFHLEAYGETIVNYNHGAEIFPVLNVMFGKIPGTSPYKSPVDMGVNMAGCCIMNDEAAKRASNDEIICRYYKVRVDYKKGHTSKDTIGKVEIIMSQVNIQPEERNVVKPALDKSGEIEAPVVAIELSDGRIVTGKTTSLLGASSVALLNALKVLGNISDETPSISPNIIEPIQKLKVNSLGNHNPRLHMDEIPTMLSISATTNPVSHLALQQLDKLKDCKAYSMAILSQVDANTFHKLNVNLTCEDRYQAKKLYHR